MKARVTVTLKSGILDPQGKAIEGALKSLGIEGVASVRQGKVLLLDRDNPPATPHSRLEGFGVTSPLTTFHILTRDQDPPPLTDQRGWEAFPITRAGHSLL